jgi:phage tail-like protein
VEEAESSYRLEVMNAKTLVLIAGAVLAVLVGGLAYVALEGDGERRSAALNTTRSYTAGTVGLEVDGAGVGFVKSIEGCDVTAPVVNVAAADGTQQKQSGAPKYTPCTVRFGSGMKAAFYQWISDSLAGKLAQKNVSIVVYDFDYKAVRRLDLAGATISRFVVPALAAASTEPVVFEVTLGASTIRRASPSGTASGALSSKSKQALAGNFKLSAPGLEADLKRVTAVGSWTFDLAPAPAGELKLSAGGQPEYGDLSVTVAAPAGVEFDAWLDGLVKGTPTKKTFSLSLLDATFTTSLVDLTLTGVGLIGADLLGSADSSTAVSKRSFTMFVEGANVKFPGIAG